MNRRTVRVLGVVAVVLFLALGFIAAGAVAVYFNAPHWLAFVSAALAFPVLGLLWHGIGEWRRRGRPRRKGATGWDRLQMRLLTVNGLVLALLILVPGIDTSRALRQHWPWPVDYTHVAGGWRTDIDQALKEARRTDRAVLVYFTSDGCMYCRKMDRNTFANDAVEDAIEESFIAVKIGHVWNRRVTKIRELYGIEGYPTVVMLDSRGRELARNRGYDAPESFLRWLQRARREL